VEFISGMMMRYNPAYLLVLLGFNDLAWHNPATDDEDVLANMEEFVKQALAVRPAVKIAIGNVPQHIPKFGELPARTDAYNKKLADAIPKWSTNISPVELVHVQESYTCGGKRMSGWF
jgi:lysophospholipase L1-like esterase